MISPKIYLLTLQSFGIKNSGVIKELLRRFETFYMAKFPNKSKKVKWTTVMIVDPEAVKNICNASVDSKGFCFYKATNRIKRHKAMDSLGFPFFAHCTKGYTA